MKASGMGAFSSPQVHGCSLAQWSGLVVAVTACNTFCAGQNLADVVLLVGFRCMSVLMQAPMHLVPEEL